MKHSSRYLGVWALLAVASMSCSEAHGADAGLYGNGLLRRLPPTTQTVAPWATANSGVVPLRYTSGGKQGASVFVGAAQDVGSSGVANNLVNPADQQLLGAESASSEGVQTTEFQADANADTGEYVTTIAPAGDCCCGSECCCCPPCCVPTYWIAGTEATFLAPDLNRGNVSYRLQDDFRSTPLDTTFGSNDIEVNDFYVAPRLWLGIQHGCCGVVARYWHMQAAEAVFDPFTFTPPGPTLDHGYFIHNRLDAYTFDLEGTKSFCIHDCKNTFSFGARYASVSHDAALSVDAQVDNGGGGVGIISGNARSNRSAFGTGFTTSLQGRKPLFCNSCIHLFYGMRGSVVWGKITNSVETDTIEVTAGATAGSYNGAVAAVEDAMFIGEAQLGVQCDYRVICFPADAFFRVALEYQYWDAGEGAATASSFAGFGGPAPANLSQGQAFANADGITMDLIGLSVGTGFTW